MSTRRFGSCIPAKLLSGVIALPLFVVSATAADRPSPVGPRAVPAPEGTALFGYGKGRLAMPTVTEDGRMLGTLADPDANGLFHIDAMLSGCMPSVPFGMDAYTFGGLYGKIRKLVAADPPFEPESFLYELEGTWILEGRYGGKLNAIVYDVLDSGRRVVAGKIYGEFHVTPPSSLALTAPWDDVALPGKGAKAPFGDARRLADPYRDSKSGPTKGGGKTAVGDVRTARSGDAYGDGKSVPRKVRKSAFDDSRIKPATDPFGDGKAGHKGKGKTPLGDAADEPSDPMVATFVLRYVFVR